MTLDYFKDKLFEMMNECDNELDIADISVNEQENTFTVSTTDRSQFEIECRKKYYWENGYDIQAIIPLKRQEGRFNELKEARK